MAPVFGKNVAGKEIKNVFAFNAAVTFHPYKVFDVSTARTALQTRRPVEFADFSFEFYSESRSRLRIFSGVQMLYFLTHYPVSHGIYVIAHDVAADSICFSKWCPTSHKRIKYPKVLKVVAAKECLSQVSVNKLG